MLRDYIDCEYVLVSEVQSKQGAKPVDIITLDGNTITASVYGAEKNRTKIVPVS